MAKVTTTEISIRQDAAKNYAEAAKNVVSALLSNVPELALHSTVTDTSSEYRVRCSLKGDTDCMIELYNSGDFLYAAIAYNDGEKYATDQSVLLLNGSGIGSTGLVYGANEYNRIRIVTDGQIWKIDFAYNDINYNHSLFFTTVANRPAIGDSANYLYTYHLNQLYPLSISAVNGSAAVGEDYYAVPIVLTNTAANIAGKIAGTNDYYQVYQRGSKFSLKDHTRFSIGGVRFYSLGAGDICIKGA